MLRVLGGRGEFAFDDGTFVVQEKEGSGWDEKREEEEARARIIYLKDFQGDQAGLVGDETRGWPSSRSLRDMENLHAFRQTNYPFRVGTRNLPHHYDAQENGSCCRKTLQDT